MSKFQAVVGTNDWKGEDLLKRQKVSESFSSTMKAFNVEAVELPILEKLEVFQKNLGESSDIVQKEMFTFDGLVLRPEGTAGVVRALCSGWEQNLPMKVSYDGSMFRKETPQKGRYRQFDQVGVELLGYKGEVSDGLAILMAHQFLKKLGIDSDLKLQVNFLGTKEERNSYKQSLEKFFSDFENKLSEESKVRLKTNVLRILDSKQEADQEIVKQAPSFSSFLGEESKKSLKLIKDQMTSLNIDFEVNERLVRGLDYYTGMVFEFVSTKLGSQGTVLAGGRYDDLVSSMGGPSTPCVGWAAGKERLAMLIPTPVVEKNIIGLIALEDGLMEDVLVLAQAISDKTSFQIEIPPNDSMAKKMKRLNKLGASYVAIIGENEKKKAVFSFKDMATGEQQELNTKDIVLKLLVKSLK